MVCQDILKDIHTFHLYNLSYIFHFLLVDIAMKLVKVMDDIMHITSTTVL